MFDDSGMSDGTNSSTGGGVGEGHTHSNGHMTLTEAGSHEDLVGSTESASSERWAHVSVFVLHGLCRNKNVKKVADCTGVS